MIYRAVTHAVLLFGLETWVLSLAMMRTVEGTYTGFLRKIIGKRARWKVDRMRFTTKVEVVGEAAGTQSEMTYIGRRQGTVAQWVVLRPIIEVCAR